MTLRDAIRATLGRSREADPKVIARRLVAKLTAEQLREAALVGVEYLTRTTVSGAGINSRNGVTRRELARRSRAQIMGEWHFMDAMRVDDLRAIAVDYRNRAQTMEDHAVEADELADQLERSGFETLGELRAHEARAVAA